MRASRRRDGSEGRTDDGLPARAFECQRWLLSEAWGGEQVSHLVPWYLPFPLGAAAILLAVRLARALRRRGWRNASSAMVAFGPALAVAALPVWPALDIAHPYRAPLATALALATCGALYARWRRR